MENDLKPIRIKPKQFYIHSIILIALIAISTAFLRIPFALNTLITYNLIFHINLASIFIFSVGIMYRPRIAFFICTTGLIIGELIYCVFFGCGEEFPIYIVFIIFSSGVAGTIISILRKNLKYEIFPMVIGGLWQFVGLLVAAYIWYILILRWGLDIVVISFSLFSMIFDLFFIPISLILNKIIRIKLKVKYLDDFKYSG